MGTRDHDEALAKAKAAFDELTRAIEADPGLDEAEKDAVFNLVNKAQANITDSKEQLEKGLRVGRIAYDLFKNPLSLLDKVGGVLGLV